MRPTREQIEAARALVACDFEARRLDMPVHVAKAYDTLLAATAELSEEELAEEAALYFPDGSPCAEHELPLARGAYIAGARREGAR